MQTLYYPPKKVSAKMNNIQPTHLKPKIYMFKGKNYNNKTK